MKLSHILMAPVAICLLILTAGQAHAQNSITVQATASVAPFFTTATGTNLTFGTVTADGTAQAVAPTDAGAAQFDIAGTPGSEITVTFTLPTQLTNGTDNIPIAFGATDAGYATDAANQATATAHDPGTVLTTDLDATTGELYVWLGGTVTPAIGISGGSYSADITIDLAYTGG